MFTKTKSRGKVDHESRVPTQSKPHGTSYGILSIVGEETYGLILEEMGFDCSKLKLVIPRIRRTPQQLSRWKDVFLRSVILDVLKAEAPQTLKRRGCTIHVIKCSRVHVTLGV